MPEHNPGQMGGTMRLGKRRTLFKSKTSVMSVYLPSIKSGLLIFEGRARTLLLFLINDNFFVTGKLYGNVDNIEERHRHRFEVLSFSPLFSFLCEDLRFP